MKSVGIRLSFVLLFFALILSPVMPAMAHSPNGTQEGWFSVIHWFPRPGSNTVAQNLYVLTFDDGHKFQLDVSDALLQAAGGLNQLKGKRVRVTLDENSARSAQESGSRVGVTALELAPLPMNIPRGAMERAVSGSQAWVTIMCAFPGNVVGQDTDTLQYFKNMYSADYPGMDHYWRQQSYGKVNLLGSDAFGWFTMTNSQTFYFPNPGDKNDWSYAKLDALAADCIGAANNNGVDFSPYVGINMMFNGELNCCAWGGSNFLTIDGVAKLWRLTWNPAWSWRDITVVSHEVGHGFGLPHSNNYDGDPDPYDNPWDVMSDTYTFCYKLDHPAYGCLGQQTNAYHKDSLGWFSPSQRLLATSNTGPVTLDHISLQNSAHYQIIKIPVPGSSRFYTVEARQDQNSGYDAKLPGKAVIIYEIDETRTEPAWLVGGTTDTLSMSVTQGADAAWLVGETFNGPNFKLKVESETADGFVVSVIFDESNLVINGGMEAIGLDNLPVNWKGKGLVGDKIKCNTATKSVSFAENCAFLFKGGAGENSSLSQSINLTNRTFAAGNVLSFDAQVNATNVATNATLSVKITYSDGSKNKGEAVFTTTSSYQKFAQTVSLLSGDVSKIKLKIQNQSLAGKVLVDDVTLRVNP